MVNHPVILRGLGALPLEDKAPPLIVRRTDADFIPALLDALRNRASLADLGAPTAADFRNGRLHLLQPIHRTFHLVLLEAVCQRPGRPRLHPRDIESAGFVIRRVSQEAHADSDLPWQFDSHAVLGWNPFGAGQWRLDPDTQRRPVRALRAPAGVHQALARIRASLEPPSEHTVPMFVAPPAVCEAAGKTILYGVVPTTSADERSSPPAESLDPQVVETLLPEFLRTGSGNYRPRGAATRITLADILASEAAVESGTFALFHLGLRTLHSVWRYLDDPAAASLRSAVNQVPLTFRVDGNRLVQQPLGDYLTNALRILVAERPTAISEGREATAGIEVPETWPFPTSTQAAQIQTAAAALLQARFSAEPTRVKRFDEAGAVYRLHAFIRVRCAKDCPPHLHWAEPSAPFSLAAWWENGGPLHTIPLPDIDSDSVKSLRPNVSFALPPKLANLLNRTSPESLIKGEGSLSANPSLGWICSFSLPIITLCAFIVLNIFLGLFHLVFQWLFYIKICLPFPKFNSPPKP